MSTRYIYRINAIPKQMHNAIVRMTKQNNRNNNINKNNKKKP